MQARLHSFFADAEALRGLARAQTLDVAEHEYRAVVLGQRVYGVLDQPAELAGIGLPIRAHLGGAHRAGGVVNVVVVDAQRFLRTLFPSTRERFVDRDPGEPGRKLRPRLALL